MVEQDTENLSEDTEAEIMGDTTPVDSESHAEDGGEQEKGSVSPKDFREISYFILFIAAVFVINAMETGSYRTPWPVAIAVSAAGLGLYGYSWYKESVNKKQQT